MTNTIRHMTVHRLIREGEAPLRAALRASPMAVTPATQRLVDQLCAQYADRVGKGFGCFEDDEDGYPMRRFVREYLEGSADFGKLTESMMHHLQACAAEEVVQGSCHVVIVRADNGSTDFLMVALLSEAMGSQVSDTFEVVDTPYLDLANLRVVGRIDLAAWQKGVERYISFLKGRGDVAPYFKQFLGCNDVVVALKETQKLVQGLGQFVDSQAMAPEARDSAMVRAHGYLDGLGDAGEEISLDAMAACVWPDAPEQLREVLASQELGLASGFVPDKRAIKPLVRFKASGGQWKVEFDRTSLRSGAVIYDKHADSLVLYNVPEHLKRALLDD